MDDEKEFSLRDRIAIEILNGIISNSKDNNDTIRELLHYMTYDSDECDDGTRKKVEHRAAVKMEKVIRNCYKVADIVRKVRLSTFE